MGDKAVIEEVKTEIQTKIDQQIGIGSVFTITLAREKITDGWRAGTTGQCSIAEVVNLLTSARDHFVVMLHRENERLMETAKAQVKKQADDAAKNALEEVKKHAPFLAPPSAPSPPSAPANNDHDHQFHTKPVPATPSTPAAKE